MKVLILGSSKLPVPAVKGGAVPNLIQQIIAENEKSGKIELTCCSLYDAEAVLQAEKYTKTEFIWAKQPGIISFLDNCVYFLLSKIIRIKRLLSLRYLFQIIWLVYFIGRVLHKGDYDQVVFENSVPLLHALRLRNNRTKYKGKYHLHMHSVPRAYYGNADLIRQSRSLICISEYVADAMLADKRLRIAEDKIQIMYNCIDTDLFSPCDDRAAAVQKIKNRHGIGQDKKILLFIGRLCKEKGIAELLQTMKLLQRVNVVLLVLGSNFYKSDIVSPYEEYLRSLIEGIEEKVVFTGYVDYSRVAEYYYAADVVVLPSMWEEPAGMTMVEAMACGRPLVTTRSGGIPEYAGINNCVLVERDNEIVCTLAQKISMLLENRELASAMASRAASHAAKYNMEYYYSQFMTILGK